MFSKKEIVDILSENADGEQLFILADKVRKTHVGDGVHLRGLIEFSNICKCTCKYCGLRCENRALERYRLSPAEIVCLAEQAAADGYKTIVLQGGEDNFFSKNLMCGVISEIKKLNVAITLSFGERSFEDYKAFKECGADRYLLRIETTDKRLYQAMHPGMSFENRVKCLFNLKELGYEVGTGCLVGLPGQTLQSLASDIAFFKEIDTDMAGIGPFIPHPDTPLGSAKSGNLTLALKVMALVRVILKDINIPATTAMETLSPDGRILALRCGANVVMPNVTMPEFRKKYEIYPGKTPKNADKSDKERIIDLINSLGRYVSNGYGFRGGE